MSEAITKALTGKNFMRSLVGILCLLFSFAIVAACLFIPIPAENKEIRVQVVTFAITTIGLVAAYYFSTSQSSTDKNEMLNKQ